MSPGQRGSSFLPVVMASCDQKSSSTGKEYRQKDKHWTWHRAKTVDAPRRSEPAKQKEQVWRADDDEGIFAFDEEVLRHESDDSTLKLSDLIFIAA
mmetsp:Transcript_72434/g.204775  ORF Transcript_72434/g.204775 Transcript_72434/m.204775 type:complete len:96 (+) Transcript_72434:126-413(+)